MKVFTPHFRSNFILMVSIITIHFVVLFLKLFAYRKTGSTAILSDALEGLINLLASTFALISLWLSDRPPDESHPYGHGKIEYFSVGFEGALILGVAFAIMKESLPRLIYPKPIYNVSTGMWILIGTMAIQFLLVVALFVRARKTESAILRAEGYHIFSDVLTTLAVLAGFLIAGTLGKPLIDPIVAIGIACFILITGFRLIRQAFSGLMDASDLRLIDEVTRLLQSHRKEWWIDIHRLRLRRVGSRIFIDLHLILPKNFHLWQANMEAQYIENILRENLAYPVDVLVHLDPCESPDCRLCQKYDCIYRKEPQKASTHWDRQTVLRSDMLK